MIFLRRSTHISHVVDSSKAGAALLTKGLVAPRGRSLPFGPLTLSGRIVPRFRKLRGAAPRIANTSHPVRLTRHLKNGRSDWSRASYPLDPEAIGFPIDEGAPTNPLSFKLYEFLNDSGTRTQKGA